MARWLTTLLAVVALVGCDFGGETPERRIATPSEAQGTRAVALLSPCRAAPPRPRPTPTQLVVQAIRECEVKRILIAHDDTMWITYRGGRTVPMKGSTRGLSSGPWSARTPATSSSTSSDGALCRGGVRFTD